MPDRKRRARKSRLRADERQRNRIMKLAREVRATADQMEGWCNRNAQAVAPGVVDFQRRRVTALREFASRAEAIAPLLALPALPKASGADLARAYAAAVGREAGLSYAAVSMALDDPGAGEDAYRKAAKRIEEKLGPGVLAKGAPLRRLLDTHGRKKNDAGVSARVGARWPTLRPWTPPARPPAR